jgi:hypothetical protein
MLTNMLLLLQVGQEMLGVPEVLRGCYTDVPMVLQHNNGFTMELHGYQKRVAKE